MSKFDSQTTDKANDRSPAKGLAEYVSLFALLLLMLALSLLHTQGHLKEILEYDRLQFHSQIWTALSHALIHLNIQHLVLNLSALVFIYILFNSAFNSLWWLVALSVSAISSAYGMYYYSPETAWCVGASGALHGLFVYAVLRSRSHILWLVAIGIKLLVEQTTWLPENFFSTATELFIHNPVIVDAHLWGAAGGFLFYGVVRSIALLFILIELNSDNNKA